MVAYLGYTLRMRTLFHGWPIMVNDTHTRRRRSSVTAGFHTGHFSISLTTLKKGDFVRLAFLVQSPTSYYDTWQNDSPTREWIQYILGVIWWTSGSGLIQKSNPHSNPGSHFGLGRFALSWVLLSVFCSYMRIRRIRHHCTIAKLTEL